MTYLCCPLCRLRLPRGAATCRACPTCDRPLERVSADAALGYQLFEITDPIPLSPMAAAVAVSLSKLSPGVD